MRVAHAIDHDGVDGVLLRGRGEGQVGHLRGAVAGSLEVAHEARADRRGRAGVGDLDAAEGEGGVDGLGLERQLALGGVDRHIDHIAGLDAGLQVAQHRRPGGRHPAGAADRRRVGGGADGQAEGLARGEREIAVADLALLLAVHPGRGGGARPVVGHGGAVMGQGRSHREGLVDHRRGERQRARGGIDHRGIQQAARAAADGAAEFGERSLPGLQHRLADRRRLCGHGERGVRRLGREREHPGGGVDRRRRRAVGVAVDQVLQRRQHLGEGGDGDGVDGVAHGHRIGPPVDLQRVGVARAGRAGVARRRVGERAHLADARGGRGRRRDGDRIGDVHRARRQHLVALAVDDRAQHLPRGEREVAEVQSADLLDARGCGRRHLGAVARDATGRA